MTTVLDHLTSLGYIIDDPAKLSTVLSRGHQGAIKAVIENPKQTSRFQRHTYDMALRAVSSVFQYKHLPDSDGAFYKTIEDVIRADGEPFPFVHCDPATEHSPKHRYPVNIGEIRHTRSPETLNIWSPAKARAFERDFTVAMFRMEEGLIGNEDPLKPYLAKRLFHVLGMAGNDHVKYYAGYLKRYGRTVPQEYLHLIDQMTVSALATVFVVT